MTWATTKCRSCGGLMFYVKTAATGKPMPLDATPSETGNVYVEQNPKTDELRAVVVGRGGSFPEGVARYTPHHATCPHGRGWSRGRSRGRASG